MGHIYTGRGVQFLFPLPQVEASHYNIPERAKKFAGHFADDYGKELDDLGFKVDSTFDLRPMIKIPGTAKANVGVVSRFYGEPRQEDNGFLDYLLTLKIDGADYKPVYGAETLDIADTLPENIEKMIKDDSKLQDLWDGNGKEPPADNSDAQCADGGSYWQ